MIFNKRKCFLIFTFVLLAVMSVSTTSAADNNTVLCENHEISIENTQETSGDNTGTISDDIVDNSVEKSIDSDDYTYDSEDNNITYSDNSIKKSESGVKKQSASTKVIYSISLNTTVVNETINVVYDTGNETAITRNITTANGVPDVTKLGVDYAYADDNGVYTITSAEILRVMKLDSYCQQIYGFTPKYTFFRVEGSNVKYVISREKWNVIARALNAYHVKQGYYSVNPPYSITVNLTGKTRYYPIYYDAQEWINGEQYTCGPTAMSMISQALNCYSSEKKLSGIYRTTSRDGTDESAIIKYSPSVHMKLVDITDTQAAVKKTLQEGKMVFWHIRGHYMCIVAYNSATDKFLCLNPSGPSHNIAAVQWATWTQVKNTDRALKENGFMAVVPYWNLTSSDKSMAKYYYYNMGGKYTTPNNSEYPNNGDDNKAITTVSMPSKIPTTTKQTKLVIKGEVKSSSGVVTKGKVSISLNGKVIGNQTVSKGIASLEYVLPAYTSNNITVSARYIDAAGNILTGNVTNTFKKNSAGKTYTNNTTFSEVVKRDVKITISPIVSKVGEKVTLKAVLQDSSGKLVEGGNIVFKINGVSLKSDKTFNSNASVLKIHVSDGMVTTSIVADKLLRNAKNISVSYSGSSLYNQARTTQSVAVALRYAQLTVTATPTLQKHYETITFKAVITDVTNRNKTFTPAYNNKSYVYFKVNNVTIKEDGKVVYAEVVNGVAEYNYTVPQGMAGITTNSLLRNYTVLAGYINPDYYPTAKNTTIFNVERSNITIAVENVTHSAADNHIRLTANLKDYRDNNLIGSNKINLKINGVSYKVDDEAVVFKAIDGVVDIDIALPDSISKVRRVEIVTGERSAYLGGRLTVTDIVKIGD